MPTCCGAWFLFVILLPRATHNDLTKSGREKERKASRNSQCKFSLHLHAVLKPEIRWNKICEADLKPFLY